jgi:Icc-related predicted phosphoesterase
VKKKEINCHGNIHRKAPGDLLNQTIVINQGNVAADQEKVEADQRTQERQHEILRNRGVGQGSDIQVIVIDLEANQRSTLQ